ncbi:MAG: response regulator [Acidimicrobiales bacterium]
MPDPAAPAPTPIRVLVVDDHEVILDGLESMLRPYSSRVVIAGRATDGAGALAELGTIRPDAVLLDVRVRGESGLDICKQILHRDPACRVVFFTVYEDEQYLFQALRVGASGFLLKQATGAELVGHLERAIQGETVVDASLAGRVALTAARLHAGEFWPGAHLGLTQRESDVLELMVHGLSNRAIAARLVVGEETVKSHVSALYRKLGAKDRSQAVAAALREGLCR